MLMPLRGRKFYASCSRLRRPLLIDPVAAAFRIAQALSVKALNLHFQGPPAPTPIICKAGLLCLPDYIDRPVDIHTHTRVHARQASDRSMWPRLAITLLPHSQESPFCIVVCAESTL